ncbi:MAG: NAD(P)H-dependent glycerol-3-phosphate dehydrogenase [Polyangiales bacterium]
MKSVGVLGAGSWGTALAKLVADQGVETRLWSRRQEQADAINRDHRNPSYLKEAVLPECLRATSDMKEVLEGADFVIVAVPTSANRPVLKDAVPMIAEGVPVLSATKGIEQGSLKLVSGIFEEIFPESRHGSLTYLGGPSFAREVTEAVPTVVAVAGHDEATRLSVQEWLNTERFRVYTTDDVIGVEVGGALKNVMAIAAGIADGMNFGHNTRAAIITRGLAELTRMAVKLGGNPLTLAGLGGMGDLVLTCTGDLSRNRRVGIALGQGKKLPQILEELGMVAEGVMTAKSAHALSKREGVEMPIAEQVYQILHEDKPPEVAMVELMTRPLKEERI